MTMAVSVCDYGCVCLSVTVCLCLSVCDCITVCLSVCLSVTVCLCLFVSMAVSVCLCLCVVCKLALVPCCRYFMPLEYQRLRGKLRRERLKRMSVRGKNNP